MLGVGVDERGQIHARAAPALPWPGQVRVD